MTNIDNLPPNFNEMILKDKNFRMTLARRSHYWFFHIYFSHYVTYKTADFQKEMFSISEDENIKKAIIVSFRGSSKSTIMNLSYSIWSILGKQNKKFVIILCQTQGQAKQSLINIKDELETNKLLIQDFGPFGQEESEWNSGSLVLSKYGARISALSSGESIRGLRHREHRPDVIVADDVEDLASVGNKESRDKIYKWFTGEVIPAGDRDTKIILIGNLLHEDSLIMRLKRDIDENRLDGIFKAYPLIDENQRNAWPDKFPSQKEIDDLKRSVGDESTWYREYLLKIIADKDRVVQREWIQYYDELPSNETLTYTITGTDLAISEKDTADYTAMVSANVYGYSSERKIYILPNPINKRLSFPDAIEEAKNLSRALGGGIPTKILVEEIAFQTAFTQQLQTCDIPAEGVGLMGKDKRARLLSTTSLIRLGKILFPRKGAEELLGQLIGFGTEKHDDLADAFSILILYLISDRHMSAKDFFTAWGASPPGN